MMRKMHYNEAMNIKLARQLIASELEEDEDADEEMRDDTEEMEEISVDPPQDGEELQHSRGQTRGTDRFLRASLLRRLLVLHPTETLLECRGLEIMTLCSGAHCHCECLQSERAQVALGEGHQSILNPNQVFQFKQH